MTATSDQLAGRQAGVDVRDAHGPVTAVVLVLPGGREHSFEPTAPRQLAAVRMQPFASAISRRAARHGVAVWLLRYRCRGWNEPECSPVVDARWALAEVRRRHGAVPVVLVGHSMGGRTAFAVGDDEAVTGICALAPWCEKTDVTAHLADRTILIVHGSRDRVTSPRRSRQFAKHAAAAGARVAYLPIRGEMHAMVFRPRLWHRLATGFTTARLGITAMPSRVERAFSEPSYN